MDADPRRHQTTGVVFAALLIGTASMLVLGLQPILLGGLVDAGRLSGAGVGQAAMIEILGLALGATAGPFLMNAGHMRAKVAVASLLLALMNLALAWAGSPASILLQRGAAGILEGLLLGAVSVILTHNERPERMSGLLLGLSTVPQMLAAYLLPVFLLPRFGVQAGFATLAAVAMLSFFVAPMVVDRVPAPRSFARGRMVWSPALLVLALAAFFQSAGIGAAWSYVERLGAQRGFEPTVIGSAMAASLAFQVLGALAAAWLSWRLRARLVLILGATLQAGLVLGLLQAQGPATFVAFACGFGLFWLALQPFLVTEVIALEPTRTAAVLLAPLALVGFSAGPLAASLVIQEGASDGAFWTAAAMLAAGAGLYALGAAVRGSSRVAG